MTNDKDFHERGPLLSNLVQSAEEIIPYAWHKVGCGSKVLDEDQCTCGFVRALHKLTTAIDRSR